MASLIKISLKVADEYPIRALKVHLKWEQGKPPGNLTVMAKSEDGTANPAAAKLDEGLFEFPLLETAHYTISAWEDLDPQQSQCGRGAACTMPARIDAGPVVRRWVRCGREGSHSDSSRRRMRETRSAGPVHKRTRLRIQNLPPGAVAEGGSLTTKASRA